MNVLDSVLIAIDKGQRSFSAETPYEADIRSFQPTAQAVLHAEDLGLVGRVHCHKSAAFGEFLIDQLEILEGLTHLGIQAVAELRKETPANEPIGRALEDMGSSVRASWQRALDRKQYDPSGAITAARTLLESVCKHILDDRCVIYDSGKLDLHELYKLTANELRLSPSGQTDEIVKQILGGCSGVVNGIGALRNKLGDAHGVGKHAIVAGEELAELAVNLAGSVSLFLVSRSR